MKVAIFVQARLGSSRLPNKIIRSLGGKPLLKQITNRLEKSLPFTDEIIIVTCHNSYSVLKKLFNDKTHIKLFAGSEENVLERFYKANQYYRKDIIIRATADNPFVSVEHLILCLQNHIKHNADLTYCKGLPLGSGVEIISSKALKIAYMQACKPYHLEHVTPYIYENKDHFKVNEIIASDPYHRPEIRLTIDEIMDFQLAERIFQALYHSENDFDLSKIIHLWDKESLFKINGNVKQKIK